MPATRAPVPEEDCQYTDIHGTTVHAPTITNILANLEPKHYALATLTLLTAMLASAATTYILLTSSSSPFTSVSGLHSLAHSPASGGSLRPSNYQYTAALTLAQMEDTSDNTLPAILPTPSLPLTASPNPDKDTPDCWSASQYSDYSSGKLYTPFFNQRRLWGNPHYTLHDVLVLVTTTHHHHRTRADVMMCTWVQELPPGHVVFVSDSEDETGVLPVVDVMKGQQLSHTRADADRLVPRGWKVAYEMGQRLGVKWYYRIDDDTFVAPNNLVRLINQYNHTDPLMAGHKCDLQPNANTGHYRLCGGAGELLSSAMLELVAPFMFDQCEPNNGDPYDIFLPRCITDRTNIEPTDRIELNSQSPDFYYGRAQGVVDRASGFGKAVSFHYVRPWSAYMGLYKLYVAFQS